jgi:anti-anti-sigma factor
VHVAGDLDLATALQFEDALAGAAPAPHVVIDLSECTFVDSTGMRLIASTVRDTDRVSVVATDPGILRVLEITAMDTMVAVHPTVDAAL